MGRAIWVKPTLIVEVAYQGIGSQGLLRQVSLKGVRPDKTLQDLVADARRAARSARKAKTRG